MHTLVSFSPFGSAPKSIATLRQPHCSIWFLSLAVYLHVYPSIHPSICISIHPTILTFLSFLSVHQSINLSSARTHSALGVVQRVATASDRATALERAKEAAKRERLLCKHREKHALGDQINHDLTYAVCFNLANQLVRGQAAQNTKHTIFAFIHVK
jgi:hypothetical protein